MNKHQNWIDQHYPRSKDAKGQCKAACCDMCMEFPELKVVRGQIQVEEPCDLPPTKTSHWWCVTPDDKVVDPTRHQYPTSILSYEPLDESKGEPTGKCMNCGNICYNESYFCSKKCESEFMEVF